MKKSEPSCSEIRHFFFGGGGGGVHKKSNDPSNVLYVELTHVYCRLKSPSQLVNLPVRKGELSSTELRHKAMADRLVEFSLGPIRNIAPFSK